MSGLLKQEDINRARRLLMKSPRLTYILQSALHDLAQNKHERQIRVSERPGAIVMRSKFGSINVFYLVGDITDEDIKWISQFEGAAELHCERRHLPKIKTSPLAPRIIASDLVSYYKLNNSNPQAPSLKPQKIDSSHLHEVAEFIRQLNDDPIDYPGMFNLPAYGVWEDGKLVAMATTLFINRADRSCQIGGFLTHPSYRGRGLATSLGKYLLAQLKAMGVEIVRLEVYSENQTAKKIYENLGFVLEDEGPMVVLSD